MGERNRAARPPASVAYRGRPPGPAGRRGPEPVRRCWHPVDYDTARAGAKPPTSSAGVARRKSAASKAAAAAGLAAGAVLRTRSVRCGESTPWTSVRCSRTA